MLLRGIWVWVWVDRYSGPRMVTRMVREPWSLPELSALRHTPNQEVIPYKCEGQFPSRDQLFYQCN